jgi:hypothetical protein
MASVRVEHVFNCSEDTYWEKIFFNEEYNERMFTEALEFPVHNQVKFEDQGDTIVRVTDVVPKTADIPGPLKKLVGDGIGYRESGRYDKKARRYTIDVTPNKMADKLFIKGTFFTQPAGEGKCKRVYEGTIEAKIFGVGGMLEKRVIADMEANYDRAAKFTNKYIAEKGL